jgi:hypothetical protein
MDMKFRARHLLALSALFTLGGCMTTLGDRSTAGRGLSPSASPYLGSFDRLWSRRTIILSQLRDGQGGGADSPREGSGFIPVTARATYMDSALIAAGLHTFADLASMNDEESSTFRSNYWNSRATGDTLFIWLELRTSATEDFLELGRWTIFLEDESGKQIEPSRFVEHPVQRQGGRVAEQEERRGDGRGSPVFAATVKKEVELYFHQPPPGSRNGNGESPRTLRLIMFETKNPLARVEGAWQIAADSVSRGPR